MKNRVLIILFAFCLNASVHGQLNMTFRSQLPYGTVQLSNLWGYVDSQNNEYALVGTSIGLSIVDVTDPSNPVEVFTIPGANSIWREVRTYGNFAYVTTEGGGGLTIVDLSNLPDSINYQNWTGNGVINGQLNKIHALHIDNGFIYLYGSNLANGGAIVADLADPWNPNYAGQYNTNYIHDGFVRNDTLYGSHIYGGYFSVIDFTNKAIPVVLETQDTPNNYTHNTWLSEDSKTIFTTDEQNNSFLTSYDISNISDINELSRAQSNPGSNSMVHNTYILNGYAVTSWYKDGVVIVDGNRPQNLVIVGNYDTSPLSGSGSNGAWGVYPYLPSGNVLVSDMEEGLFVLTPTYIRGCYLEGTVTDSICGVQLNDVTVEIVGTGNQNKITNLAGEYKTGVAQAGTYTVTFSSPGYTAKTYTGVVLSNNVVTNIDVELYSPTAVSVSGNISDSNNSAIVNTNILLFNNATGYNLVSDNDGDFSKCNILSDTYEVVAGKWNYITRCLPAQSLIQSTNNIDFIIDSGIYDDFTFNYGWTKSGDATVGTWVRSKPIGTFYDPGSSVPIIPSNPNSDVSNDCTDKAYVTGNGGGGNIGDNDVDGGRTILTSPVFDLTPYSDPYVNYNRWFFNDGGGSDPNDSLIVKLNNGTTSVIIEVVTAASDNNSTWVQKSFKVSDFISPTAAMTISFDVVDASPGHLVEAGVDKFEISETSSLNDSTSSDAFIKVFPNPFYKSTRIEYKLNRSLDANARIVLLDITGRIAFEQKLITNQGFVNLDSELAGGVYFAKLHNGAQESQTVKVVKMK